MRWRPLEAMNLIALATLGALGLGLTVAGRLKQPLEPLLTLAALAVGVLLMAWLATWEDSLPAPVRILVNFYPAAFLPILFNTLGSLIGALRGGARDDLLIEADRKLFGVDVTIWAERFVTPFANTYFSIAYATYYFVALVLAGLLWAWRRPDGRRFFFTIVLCYHVSYTGYFVIPGLGPRFALADRQTVSVHDTAISKAIDDTLNRLEQTKFDVFPSGHTLIAVAVLLVSWKRLRPAFWFYLPVITSLVISTVYCRYHYAIDVVAGILLAFILVPIGDRLYDRLMERRETRDQELR